MILLLCLPAAIVMLNQSINPDFWNHFHQSNCQFMDYGLPIHPIIIRKIEVFQKVWILDDKWRGMLLAQGNAFVSKNQEVGKAVGLAVRLKLICSNAD
jgi:hypothetical protein